MDPLVHHQVIVLGEGFPTLVTRVGPFSRVRPVMQNEGGIPFEALATLCAFVQLLPRVTSPAFLKR